MIRANDKAGKTTGHRGASLFGADQRLVISLIAFVLILQPGCRQEMARQPKYLPLQRSEFFADGRSARPLEAGVVARGHLRTDWQMFAGRRPPTAQRARIAGIVGVAGLGPLASLAVGIADSPYVDAFPVPITSAALNRGRERFRIYCAVCHDAAGYGNGIIVQRGFTRPPSYHSERLRTAPVGYLYEVITHGFGSMPDYSAQIPPRDRWAIAAYVRALQISQHMPLAELPDRLRTKAASVLENASASP